MLFRNFAVSIRSPKGLNSILDVIRKPKCSSPPTDNSPVKTQGQRWHVFGDPQVPPGSGPPRFLVGSSFQQAHHRSQKPQICFGADLFFQVILHLRNKRGMEGGFSPLIICKTKQNVGHHLPPIVTTLPLSELVTPAHLQTSPFIPTSVHPTTVTWGC